MHFVVNIITDCEGEYVASFQALDAAGLDPSTHSMSSGVAFDRWKAATEAKLVKDDQKDIWPKVYVMELEKHHVLLALSAPDALTVVADVKAAIAKAIAAAPAQAPKSNFRYIREDPDSSGLEVGND